MITKIKQRRKNSLYNRLDIEALYANKFYNLFMNKFKFEGIDYQQQDFIMKRFWADGTIACYKIPDTEGSSDFPNGLLAFTPYAPNEWNLYDYPIYLNLINLKGVRFLPSGRLKVDKDVVIGFIQRNRKGVYMMIKPLIDKLVAIEMTIKANLNANKMPYLLIGDSEDQTLLSELFEKVMNDDDNLYLTSSMSDKIKILLSGAPYIIDKLYSYKQCIENEIKEYLGLDNLGVNEKKEHLINSEIEANDEIIESYSNQFLDNIQEFIERINKVFNQNLKVSLNEDIEELEANEDEEVSD